MIKGLGKQMISACAGLFCYYLICLPLSYVFAFSAGMGLNGLWLGMPVGMVVLNFFYAAAVWCPNWELIAHKRRLVQAASDLELK